jgi:hypothetical protein
VRTKAIAAVAVLGVVVAGCGGSSDGGSGQPPDELVGTYTTRLEPGDVAGNDAPELRDASERPWMLRIGATGGPDDGPFLAIDFGPGDNLESPALRVESDRLLLDDEECAKVGRDQHATYVFYDNEYRWSLDGDTLTIETVKNQCPDRVAETILTSRPWTRTEG